MLVNNEWHAADASIEPKCQKIVERWLEGNEHGGLFLIASEGEGFLLSHLLSDPSTQL